MLAEQATLPRRTAAFFDVDRTLLRGSSLLHVVRPLRRDGFLSNRAVLHSLVLQARFSMFGFDELQIRDAVRGAGTVLVGVETARLVRFANRVVPIHVLPRVYAEARARIAWHRQRGDLIFLVSSSPREFIVVLGELLGVDGVAASEAETVDGRCTGGILRLCHGEVKAQAVGELALAHDVDLASSYAYGDSFASDLPMLASVGHPVCVNPDRRLALHAQSLGWQVERFQRAAPPSAGGLRRLPHRVLTYSTPAARRARGHVRDTARTLRDL